MTDRSADPVLDRLFRHMAWANRALVETLAGLPDAALACTAPGSAWTVARTVHHLVAAAGGYAARLEGVPRPAPFEPPATAADLAALAARCADADARLRAAAALPDGIVESVHEGRTVRRARATVLAQAVHHATEHRAQIAGALAANGIAALDLDALDLWAFGEAEGLGA